jgi:5'-nucleotidase
LLAMPQKLLILHTNDIHSFFEQMPKVAAVIKQRRGKMPADHVLTIDCGDHMDRMRMETEGSSGAANIEIMNQTGYEAAVLGNNEGLTFPPEILSEVYTRHANFPVIGSNMYNLSDSKIPSWMEPYLIINKGNLRVGIIGVTINFDKFYQLLGWDVRDPIHITAELVKELRDKTDVIIVISHLGLTYDQRMAEQIEGIDCILGGHTHHLLEKPIQIGNTYICGAGKFGQYVGEIELHYDHAKQSVTDVKGRCIEVSSYPGDEEIEAIIAKYQHECKAKLSSVSAVLEQPLEIAWNKESSLGNLLAAGIRKWTDAEIGIVNAGQIMQSLERGEISMGRILEICPPPINPCRMRLTGAAILRALEESLLDDFINLPIRGFGFRGKVLGCLCVDGMYVEYNASLGSYEKITGVWINGETLERNRSYLVGSIDMFTFGAGYMSLKEGSEIKYYLPEFIRDVLRHQLLNKEEIHRSRDIRWREIME